MRLAVAVAVFCSAFSITRADVVEDFESTPIGAMPSSPYWGYVAPSSAGGVVDDGTGNHVVEITDQQLIRYSIPIGTQHFGATTIDLRATVPGKWEGLNFTGDDTWQTLTTYTYLQPPYTGLSFQFPAGSGRVWVDNVEARQATALEVAGARRQQFETLVPTLATYDFSAPAGRHNPITRTIDKLKSGDDVQMLMLGDSIVGDSFTSLFHAKVAESYPGSLSINLKIRGTTGVQYYQDPANLQAYVLDHPFDVLFIGGISYKSNGTPTLDAAEAALRSVIDQVHTARGDIDIILSSELAGANVPALAEAFDPAIHDDWRARLREVAADYDHIAVIDPWQWYDAISDSGLPYEYFMRDYVHMGMPGHLLAGEVLGEWFSPNNNAVVPEPATPVLLVGLLTMLGIRRRKV